jgi:hypothetical protein
LRITQLEGERQRDSEGSAASASMHRLELALVAAQRKRLNELARRGEVSDAIRRRVERDLDLDEERLRGNLQGLASTGEDVV